MTDYTDGEIERLQRSELLLGTDAMLRLAHTRVLLFGVGGVGSWCAEALVRSGVHNLTLVDNDSVSASNCNRQLMATSLTVGHPKVEALRDRLLEINPDANIITIQQTYSRETAAQFHLEKYDFVIDAIDSLKDKMALILHATETEGVTFLSSMGAALRIDPTRVRVGEFWSIEGDPLARALRKKFKHDGRYPKHKFLCAYSEELPMMNKGVTDDTCEYKAVINGSLAHITATFGMALAGKIVELVVKGK